MYIDTVCLAGLSFDQRYLSILIGYRTSYFRDVFTQRTRIRLTRARREAKSESDEAKNDEKQVDLYSVEK